MGTLEIILTSAAVSALISGGLTLTGQFWERRSRKRELLLSKSLELAQERRKTMIELSESTKVPLLLKDDITVAETYYQWLDHLFLYGKLPKEHADLIEAQEREIEDKKDRQNR